ncbi:MAG: 23S rRNA (adenine(2503)-C(2))-methyltransferase RlmN [Candidatus Moraniibacteriota bacterium]
MNRHEQLEQLLKDMPKFRLKQAESALFFADWKSWNEVSTLAPSMREVLTQKVPWLSIAEVVVLKSKDGATYKAVVKGVSLPRVPTSRDFRGDRFETVLMKNARGHWSVCVSSQVGCAMGCTFCATGKMGLIRNLTSDEIVDQYRFWKLFLAEHPDFSQHITNIVFMGMGEPLNNYENVREALRELLAQTEMGPTRLVVSTVGLVPMLYKLLNDPLWPPVRLAVSLHSADPKLRQEIMPTSYPDFLEKLAEWAQAYFEKFDTRRRHVTFEYIMLEGVNDTPEAADLLANFANRVGKVRINLIPYNPAKPEVSDRGASITASEYRKSVEERVQNFQSRLEAKGVTVTKRRTMGDDIAAACGQLVTKGE